MRYILLLTLVAMVLLWPGVQRAIQVDNSLQVWFLENDPALAAYQDFQERFGNDEVIILVVKDTPSVLSPAYFRKFMAVTQALEAIPQVAGVIGPGNTTLPTRETLGIFASPLLTAESNTADVQQTLAQVPTLREQLFTPDYKAARFVIVIKKLADFDQQRGAIVDRITQTVYQHFSPKQAALGGVGIIYAGLNALSQHDFGFFLGVGYLLMFVLFWWIYRKFLLLLYTIGIVALATYLTLGVYGAFGFQLNLMTVLLPVIIVLLGVMDAIHVINEQHSLMAEGLHPKEADIEALRKVWRPCAFTTFTTAAGFLSLLTSPMAILKNFGVFAAIGIFFCLFFTYLLGALILPHTRPSPKATTFTSFQLARFLHLVSSKKRLFTTVSCLLILFFSVGITFLQTDTYTLGYFPDDHPVVQNHLAMEQAWGPYMPLELMVEPRAGYTLHSVEVVQGALAFADSAKTLSGVGGVFGFHSLYQASLEARYRQKGKRLLKSKGTLTLAHQQLAANYPQLAGKFIHEPSGSGRITVSGAMLSAQQLRAKVDTLMAISDATLGKVARVTPAGYQPMYASIVNYVTTSQVNSLLLSFVLILGLVWLFIRDLKLAALTVIPNLFPVLVMMGVMGWLGIHLDMATASIGAIVLSFCVDDSIHFIYHYQHNCQQGKTPAEARLATITHVGSAIVLTGIVLFFGYSFMMLGSLKTVQLWGLLTACSIVGAMYGELVIFPLVLEHSVSSRMGRMRG